MANAEPLLLNDALNVARVACSGIGDSLSELKTKAGINTAVTGVRTVAGGVALGTGLAIKFLEHRIMYIVDLVIFINTLSLMIFVISILNFPQIIWGFL